MGTLDLININSEGKSIKINVTCCTLKILEGLWDDYCSGHLNAKAEECLITEKVKDELGMENITLTTTILEEDYLACKSVVSKKNFRLVLLVVLLRMMLVVFVIHQIWVAY